MLDAPEREGDDAETVAEQARERKIAVEQGRERREILLISGCSGASAAGKGAAQAANLVHPLPDFTRAILFF